MSETFPRVCVCVPLCVHVCVCTEVAATLLCKRGAGSPSLSRLSSQASAFSNVVSFCGR